ncbi:MAG: hypothetical protein JWL68_3148 [Actinomycetia bacterium]|nr:hypothetical protein [Actinomycetes bacterium]
MARPSGMTSSLLFRAAASSALLAGACLLAAGCSAGGSSTSSASGPAAQRAPARAAAGDSAAQGSAASGSAASGPAPYGSAGTGSTSLTAQPAASSIIYTAGVTVRAKDLTRAAAQATQLARAAGGYVSSENTALNRAHPDRSTVSLQLKIPVSAYQATLGALSTQLGTRLAMSQHAQDVTQTVADVTSRVTSAQAAISQLRALLRHAGSVTSLLTVQNQINDQESGLESLLARQRALTHETSFATVNMLLVAYPHAVHQARHHHAGGFVGGLKAGWHGLVRVVSLVLTAAGAALPFAVILAVLAYAAYRARRWYLQRRSTPGPATPPDPAAQP